MSSPSTISSFLFSTIGASGAKIGLKIGAVSLPVGRHLLLPLPSSCTAPPGVKPPKKRCAGVAAAGARADPSMISSHGSAIAMLPAPRSTARRFRRNFAIKPSILCRQVEEGVGLRELDQQLFHVAAALLEGGVDGRLHAGVAGIERLALAEFEPMLRKASLRRVR